MGHYKLFIGHISPETRTKDLERFFKVHGFSKSIVEVVVKAGYGFVVFEDRRDADDAISELDGKELLDSRLQIQYAKSGRDDRGDGRYSSRGSGGPRYGYGGGSGGFRPRNSGRDSSVERGRGGYSSKFGRPYNTEYRVIIENLSTRCDWQDVKDYFRQAGEVTFAKCHRERSGRGVVEFASHKDMQNAIKMLDGTELYGKRLKLTCDGDRSARSRSRSSSGSPRRRSRSLSHSPTRLPIRSPMRGESPARRASRSRSRSLRRSFSRSPQRLASRSHSRSPR